MPDGRCRVVQQELARNDTEVIVFMKPVEEQDLHQRISFTISLADVPIRIRCRHEENMTFLREYLTDREPLFTVSPTAHDLARIRQELDRITEAEGRPREQYSDFFLENNAIHALIAEKLAAFDTLLYHGSALCMDGQAYIFTAPSGTGKSTHARLWREAFGDRVWMINDDKPLIRSTDGKAWVYGSPWDGKHHLSRNASAPLKAILWLKQSKENRLEPIPRPDAYQVLLRQGYTSRDAATARRILGMKMKLLDCTAFYRMYCNMETDAALTAWKGVNRT